MGPENPTVGNYPKPEEFIRYRSIFSMYISIVSYDLHLCLLSSFIP